MGYTLHLGTEAGFYPIAADIGRPPEGSSTAIFRIYLDDTRDAFIALSSYDGSGESSVLSNEVRVTALAPAPPAPTPDPGADSGPRTDPPPISELPDEPGPASRAIGAWLGLTADESGLIRIVLNDGSLQQFTLDSLAGGGDIRPARCDLDGDGDLDLVLGFGTGSNGQIALLHIEDGAVSSVSTVHAGHDSYQLVDGQTHPACGDIDGDGRTELVVGLGPDANELLHVFDDISTGFSDFDVVPGSGFPFVSVAKTAAVASAGASTIPALGDIDGDGRDELIVGFDSPAAREIAVHDDALSGFAAHETMAGGEPLVTVASARDLSPDASATFPAVGDYDGDGVDEIVVGFGTGNGGWLVFLDDTLRERYASKTVFLAVPVGRTDYRAADGSARPAFGDIDGDGLDEIVVGFGATGANELQVLDDARSMSVTALTSSGGFVPLEEAGSMSVPAPMTE